MIMLFERVFTSLLFGEAGKVNDGVVAVSICD